MPVPQCSEQYKNLSIELALLYIKFTAAMYLRQIHIAAMPWLTTLTATDINLAASHSSNKLDRGMV